MFVDIVLDGKRVWYCGRCWQVGFGGGGGGLGGRSRAEEKTEDGVRTLSRVLLGTKGTMEAETQNFTVKRCSETERFMYAYFHDGCLLAASRVLVN